jgi:2-polyprenyl-3-methyl-5-hydroxy-6-metoxy-1,4-benzoquinol methylase
MNHTNAFWDNRFADAAYAYGTQPNVYFKQQLDAISKPGRLLLLAEGEGRNAVYAAQQGWKVTAVDFSEKGRTKALALAAEKGVSVEYILANIQSYDMLSDGPWDAIGLIYFHLSTEQRSAIHQKCAQALKPGGALILEAFHLKQIERLSGGPKDLDMLYTQRLLADDFVGLEVLEAMEITTVLQEGEGHKGEAEVVRLCLKMPK